MTRRPLVPCLDCRALSRNGSRCTRCQAVADAQRDQQRGSASSRGYGARWRSLARAAMAAHPYCAGCGATSDLTVDHVVPIARGGTPTPENLQVLCRSCNSAKGARP